MGGLRARAQIVKVCVSMWIGLVMIGFGFGRVLCLSLHSVSQDWIFGCGREKFMIIFEIRW